MSADLVWRKRAEIQLQSILDFISVDNVNAAEGYIESILTACDRLRDFPLSGRVFNKDYRALVVHNHLVLYRYQRQGAKVIIAAVVDGRRDIEAVLRDTGEEET